MSTEVNVNMSEKLKINGNIVHKHVPSDLLHIELEKTKQAKLIGEQNDLFYVPGIIGFDEKESCIDYEYLSGLDTIQDIAVSRNPQLMNILQRVGKALASVHNKLVLPEDMKNLLPSKWTPFTDDNVFLHGDFTGKNVCYHKATDRIVLLDWSTARFVGQRCTFGSRYFDIAWFIYFLFYFMPATSIIYWKAGKMADAFIEGYSGYNQTGLIYDIFRGFLFETQQLKHEKFMAGGRDLPRFRRTGYYILSFWKSYRYRHYKPHYLKRL
jgi:tRNA A-37 threonylcarbamoyl transferase component Bud32